MDSKIWCVFFGFLQIFMQKGGRSERAAKIQSRAALCTDCTGCPQQQVPSRKAKTMQHGIEKSHRTNVLWLFGADEGT